MSTDFSIRPVGAPAPSPVVPPPSRAVSEAVTTELPASQSVTAVDVSASATNDQPVGNDLSRQAFFDRDAAAVVFQVVDNRTDQVVKQYPDEAVLRRRAYFHTLDLTKASSPRVRATDRTA
jgi:hypothetical protein